MILSYNWLKELTGTELPPDKLAEKLTRAGLNVEEVTKVEGGDHALNADITTNRPDWLCHLGVAHEIAAIENIAVKAPPMVISESGTRVDTLTSVTVVPGAETACPRYTARVIRGVKVGPSPEWLRKRLVSIGQRSINNIVDITNLVCFEMNQPLHAFDMDKLAEKRIVVRMAKKGEAFEALTGEKCALEPDMLVIADAEKAVALAGVKGGLNTEVGEGTVNVLLESAWFQPKSVRSSARRTKTASESSYRFERGIDPGMTERASARAARLIQELAGGELAMGIIDTNPDLGQPWNLTMRFERCDKLLGFAVSQDEIREIFKGLGLTILSEDTAIVTVRVPSFRQDLKREIDLIEEVVRLAGYNRIPEKITLPLALAHELPETRISRVIRRTLAGLGYHECITDSFVPPQWAGPFAPGAQSYRILNPINAERACMRGALVPSLLEVRRTNRLADGVKLFEIGRVYHMTAKGPVERVRLAVLDDAGVEYVRGALESVVGVLSLAGGVEVVPDDAVPGHAPGSGGRMTLGGVPLATLGLLAKREAEGFDLFDQPAVAEAEIGVLIDAPRQERTYRPLPRFPGVRRDISLSLPEGVKWVEVEREVRKCAPMLDGLAFESLYRGKGLKAGRKALAFSMVFRAADRSLTDEEANEYRDVVAQGLLMVFPEAELR